jgi:hypothetical protein
MREIVWRAIRYRNIRAWVAAVTKGKTGIRFFENPRIGLRGSERGSERHHGHAIGHRGDELIVTIRAAGSKTSGLPAPDDAIARRRKGALAKSRGSTPDARGRWREGIYDQVREVMSMQGNLPLDQVQRAILMGCARKYVALFNNPGGFPITCLQYFAGIVEEIATVDMSMDYWRYLALRMRRMESQWRAQATFAPATAATNTETN